MSASELTIQRRKLRRDIKHDNEMLAILAAKNDPIATAGFEMFWRNQLARDTQRLNDLNHSQLRKEER